MYDTAVVFSWIKMTRGSGWAVVGSVLLRSLDQHLLEVGSAGADFGSIMTLNRLGTIGSIQIWFATCHSPEYEWQFSVQKLLVHF